VVGSAFVCNTTSTLAGGEAPLHHIDISFVQVSVSHNLAAVDTASQEPFKLIVEIPDDARGGPARIVAVSGSAKASAAITVLAPLARTGAPLLSMGEAALIMLVIGTATRITVGIWDY
jgi:hypothetical protein